MFNVLLTTSCNPENMLFCFRSLWTSCSKWSFLNYSFLGYSKKSWRPSTTKVSTFYSVGRRCKVRKSFWAVFRISSNSPFNCCPTLGSWRNLILFLDKIILAANNSWITVSRNLSEFIPFSFTISSSFCMTRFSVRCKFSVRRLSFRSKLKIFTLISLFSPNFSFLPSEQVLDFLDGVHDCKSNQFNQ